MKFQLTFLTILLFSFFGFSQNPVFRKYTVDDGLAGNEIYHTIQDSKGFIWIATTKGVARFDGNRFENFTVENGLSDNEILKIHEDYKGRIWFISFTGPLSYYDGTVHNAANTNFLKQLQFQNLVQTFTPLTENEILLTEKTNATFLLNDTVLRVYDTRPYYSIIKQNDASIIFISWKDISEKSAGQQTFKTDINSNSFKGHAVYDKLKNRTILVTDSGLYSYKEHQLRRIDNSPNFAKKMVRFISCDQDGYNWLGNDDGCFRFLIDEHDKVILLEKFFTGYAVNSVSEDRDHNFWIATRSEGLLMVPSLNVKLFNKDSGFSDDNITTAVRTPDHKIICGLLNGDVYVLDTTYKIVDYKKLNCSRVRKILTDRFHQTYVASEGGIFHYTDGRFEKIFSVKSKPIKSMVTSIYREGILAGGMKAVIGINNKREIDTILETKNESRVYSICEVNRNEFWLATEKGVYVWKGNSIMPFHPERKPFTGWIDELCKRKDGKILMATRDSGLAMVSENNILFINTLNGLQSNACNSLYYDSLKDIAYVGTNKGLSIISFGKNNFFEIKNFGSSNGLDCGSIYSLYESGGELLLCTNKGLLVFREGDLNKSAESTKVYLSTIEINSRNVALHPDYYLEHYQNNIRIIYDGVAFRNAKDLQYRYQLVPLDTGWNRTSSNSIIYSDLKPGDYHFNVQVYSGNQTWSAEASTVSFHISKPFWNTWWFRISAALLLSGLIVSYYNARIQRIRKKQQIMNELLQTELKALRAQINPHFIFNSLNSIQDFIFRNEKEEANSYLSKFASLMRMILDNSSKKFITLNEEIRFINLYIELESLRFQGKFNYMLRVSKDIVTDNIFLPPMILQPYIENAIIHGLAPKKSSGILSLSFKLEKNFLVCIIEDNGTGRKKPEEIKEQAEKSGHHSFAMKANNERIEAINKSQQVSIKYKIEDLEDIYHQPTGTKIVLNFPQDPV